MADFGLSEAALALSAVGTTVSAAGALNTAAANAENSRYQAAVARNDRIVADQNAQYASQAGAAATTRAQLKQRQELGALGAGFAAGGLDPNSGTPTAVRSSASELTQLDTATTSSEAARRVYGFRTNATSYGAEAQLRSAEAGQADIAGPLSAGSTFLSGVGGLAAKWKPYQFPPGSGFGSNPGSGTGGLY